MIVRMASDSYYFILFFYSIMGLPSVGMAENAGPMKVIKAARVLRPLKLVSGVPSRFYYKINMHHNREKWPQYKICHKMVY